MLCVIMNQTSNNNIRRAVMRRIYFIFAGRLLSHPITVNIALFAVALTIFREVVFVKRVLETLLNTPLGQLPDFFIHALMRGEVVTFAALGIMAITALSFTAHVRTRELRSFTPQVA